MKNGRYEDSEKIVFYKDGLIHNEEGPAIIYKENLGYEWYFKGERHRINGPAVEMFGYIQKWYQKGKLHRDNDPALVNTLENGSLEWYQNGLLHRDNGPAIQRKEKQEWYQKGLLHRVDGPAIEWTGGQKEWYQHGKRHRLDGPAISMLKNAWYIDGVALNKKQIFKIINQSLN